MVAGQPDAARRVLTAFDRGDEEWPRADLARAHVAAGCEWREECAALAWCIGDWLAAARTRLVGISGGQGTGKSTLSASLACSLAVSGRRAVVLSIDDLYRTRAERQELARAVHPLLATRGVPGTHDVALGRATFDALLHGTGDVFVPVFDKGRDDRGPPRRVRAPADVLIFEGWCVGVGPQPAPALLVAANALERDLDGDLRYRRFVNEQLETDYAALFARVERLVVLLPPDFDAVRRWRGWQEQQLPLAQRMDEAALDRFVAHYERLTRHGIATLPARADICVRLDAAHGIAAIERR